MSCRLLRLSQLAAAEVEAMAAERLTQPLVLHLYLVLQVVPLQKLDTAI